MRIISSVMVLFFLTFPIHAKKSGFRNATHEEVVMFDNAMVDYDVLVFTAPKYFSGLETSACVLITFDINEVNRATNIKLEASSQPQHNSKFLKSIVRAMRTTVYKPKNEPAPKQYRALYRYVFAEDEKDLNKNCDAVFDYMAKNHIFDVLNQQQKNEVSSLIASAKSGNAISMHKLGMMYFEGKHVTQDCKLAYKYFNDAIKAGELKALLSLGRFRASGCGVVKPSNLAAYTSFYSCIYEEADWKSECRVEANKIGAQLPYQEFELAVYSGLELMKFAYGEEVYNKAVPIAEKQILGAKKAENRKQEIKAKLPALVQEKYRELTTAVYSIKANCPSYSRTVTQYLDGFTQQYMATLDMKRSGYDVISRLEAHYKGIVDFESRSIFYSLKSQGCY